MRGSPFSSGGSVMSQPAVQPSVSPLRQRMLEDMAMRGLREETQRDYVRSVRSFAAFLRRSPDTATIEAVRRFQVDRGLEAPRNTLFQNAALTIGTHSRCARSRTDAGTLRARAQT